MYEANPIAFLAEQAGGAATDGTAPHPGIAANRLAPEDAVGCWQSHGG